MAEEATIARPYANALFDVAKVSDGDLNTWTRMLGFAAAAASAEHVQDLLMRPNATADDKARTLISLCGDELDDRGRNLVHLLAQNKRLELLPEIATQFEDLRAKAQMTLDVEVTSAFDVTQSALQVLTTALERRFGREIKMTSRVDRTLVGGAVIRAGDTVIDGSVKGRLEKLREALARP